MSRRRRVDPQLWTLAGLVAVAVVARIARSTPLVVFATVGALALLVLLGWQRACLDRVTFQRSLSEKRSPFNGRVEIASEVVNDKLLPLTWLEIEDQVPGELEILEGTVSDAGTYAHALVQYLAVLPYQRVRRNYTVLCDRRGAYEFGPARITSGDPFGIRRRTQAVAGTLDLLVYPKVFRLDPPNLALRAIVGDQRARARAFEDPSRVAGVRRYRPGDPLRAIDWRATARRSEILVRQFEPATALSVAVLLDLQVRWVGVLSHGASPPELEFLVAVGASFGSDFARRRLATGLYTNGTVGGRPVALAPSTAAPAEATLLEALARVSALDPVPMAEVVERARRDLVQGTTVLAISTDFGAGMAAPVAELRREHPVTAVWVDVGTGAAPAAGVADSVLSVRYADDWAKRESLELAL